MQSRERTFRLELLGAARLRTAEGREVAVSPRSLALLAVLALGRTRGVPRERLLGWLWPDASAERARHALDQAFYALRRSTSPRLLASTDPLRLDPATVQVDLWEFERLLDAGAPAEAVAHYRGALADGMTLTGLAELEPWLDGERRHLEVRYLGAVEDLARRAEVAGDTAVALANWRRLLSVDPLSAVGAAGLIRGLTARGDPLAAVRFGEEYAARLKDDLDCEPDAAGRGAVLAARVRAGDSAELPLIPASSPRPPSPTARAQMPEGRAASMPPPRRLVSTWMAAIPAAGIVVMLSLAFAARRPGSTLHAPARGNAPVVAVAPFAVSRGGGLRDDLAEGLVDLVTAEFQNDHGWSTVDPNRAIRTWERLAHPDPDAAAAAVDLAHALRADLVVCGSAARVGDSSVVLSARLIEASSGRVVSRGESSGPLRSLPELAARLATSLFADLPNERDRRYAIRTASVDALEAYFAGRALFRQGRYSEAEAAFRRALQQDSSLTAAALGLLTAGLWTGSAWAVAGSAWRARDRLAPGDRALVEAIAGPHWPDAATERETLQAWERAALAQPQRAEAWLALGDRLKGWGLKLDVDDWPGRARAAYRTALDLDPSLTGAIEGLVELDALTGDTASLRGDAARLAAADPPPEDWSVRRWLIATLQHDSSTLRELRGSFERWPGVELYHVVGLGQRHPEGLADAHRAVLLFERRASMARERRQAALLRHDLALNEGHPAEAAIAAAESRRFEAKEPLLEVRGLVTDHASPHATDRVLVRDAVFWTGDTSAARAAVAALDRLTRGPVPADYPSRAVRYLDECALSQWWDRQHDWAHLREALGVLRSTNATRDSMPTVAFAQTCAAVVDAELAVGTNARRAAAAVAALDSAMLVGRPPFPGLQFANLVLARLQERLGDDRDALRALRRMYWDVTYRSTVLRELSDLAQRSGDTALAARARGALAGFGAPDRPSGGQDVLTP